MVRQLDSDEIEPIYHHNGIQWIMVILIIIQALSIGFFLLIVTRSFIIFSIINLLLFYTLWYIFRKDKSSYNIYNDRIEFFNEYYPKKKEIIKTNEIYQVRYEDEFGFNYNYREWLIYFYLTKNHSSSAKRIKENRFSLKIKKKDKVNRIIKILQFFKEQDKEIYILTKYKKINESLELKNWNNP